MKKRVLSLLLAGALTCSLFTGCGSPPAGDAGDSGDSKAAGESGQESADGEEEAGKEEASAQEPDSGDQELTTVKILCKNDFNAEVKVADWEKYPVSQILIQDLEEIGIRLELECIDNESIGNVINTRMASGVDLPDLIAYCWIGGDENDVLDWARNGLVYSVNELLEQYDTDGSIRAFYDEKAPGGWERNAQADGSVWWFSYLANAHDAVDKETAQVYEDVYPFTLSIREDWVKALGEEVKDVYTPDELFELVKRMQEQDVNGNGKPDEVFHVDITSFNNGVAQGFGLSNKSMGSYFEGENKVFSNFYHENFPAYVEFMKKLYDNGLYDTSSLSASVEQVISENRAAVVYNYAMWDFEFSLPELEDGVDYYRPILVDMDGDLTNGFCTLTDSNDVMTYNQYFVPKSCEHPEAVVKLMDYVYTDKYAKLVQLGIEGKHYEVDENGNYVILSVDAAQQDDSYKTLFETGLGLFALPRFILYPEVKERSQSTESAEKPYMVNKQLWRYKFCTELYPMADKREFGGQFLAIPTDEESAVVSEKSEALFTYASELVTDLILGNKSLDDLPEYQQELESLGIKEYMDAIQARRDRIVGND
ncbi:extracellular solute-binding protein [uncultured Acetatifactor sp.]|uniref:extracellular solute-binding protein n=1 Tax=uncultured Acetatifactor sp. TaxID=1671927 RepID=UPI0026251455|nr:extracellular solute-binding protein [uncultured Acetatifactor sp.]